MKKFNAGTVRKLGSILLLAAITGTFLSVYYFIYLPRQKSQFNAQTFRSLNNLATNFVISHSYNYVLVKPGTARVR